ncbi:hypothetical protein [Acinetobacter thermotolerans]|uniref:hypothetical protein n=1 Tax=Acinetobacter thermotolerans TaxID=3151487 RepID=UPI00325A96D3
MMDTITDQNATAIELSAEQKLKLENLQLKIRVCELTRALASAEQHIYETEYKGLLARN